LPYASPPHWSKPIHSSIQSTWHSRDHRIDTMPLLSQAVQLLRLQVYMCQKSHESTLIWAILWRSPIFFCQIQPQTGAEGILQPILPRSQPVDAVLPPRIVRNPRIIDFVCQSKGAHIYKIHLARRQGCRAPLHVQYPRHCPLAYAEFTVSYLQCLLPRLRVSLPAVVVDFSDPCATSTTPRNIAPLRNMS